MNMGNVIGALNLTRQHPPSADFITAAKNKGLLIVLTWLARYIEVLCQIGLDVHVVFFDGPEAAPNMICRGKSLPPGRGHPGHLPRDLADAARMALNNSPCLQERGSCLSIIG